MEFPKKLENDCYLQIFHFLFFNHFINSFWLPAAQFQPYNMVEILELCIEIKFMLHMLAYFRYRHMNSLFIGSYFWRPSLLESEKYIQFFVNLKSFLICVFAHSDWIRRFTVFTPITGKYGQAKLRVRTLFTLW